jgi:shikimate kinase
LKRSIVLVGLMGSGKTSVGRELAALLGLPWADLDALLVQAHGPIPRQFERDGEAKFRQRESRLLAQALRRGGVLSTGGGVVLAKGNRSQLKRQLCVYLRASPAVLAKRLKGEAAGRPLLKGQALGPRLRRLSAERGRFYRECATLTVQAGLGSARAIAARTALRLKAFPLS